ncbi:MAG: TonB-dependent receptor [Steroidobacteraceae bacterium]
MSWINRRILGAAGMASVLGMSVLLGGEARAQQAASTGENTINEIVVTAQKRPELLQQVPVAVTVVTATQLADEHIYSIADLARTTPGLEMVQAFGGPGGGGQIRGIGTTSFNPTAEGAVGIVVDGVPQGNVNITNLYDMQRIEVLKGPQGTLFGLTSSAGVINMVTAAPDPTKFYTTAHIDYSDDGAAGSKFGEETERAVLNAPISSNAAIRLAVSDDRTKGVQVNNFSGTDNVATEWGGRLRFLLNATDDLTINLSGDYDRRGQNYNDPQFTYVSANPGLAAELAACGITPGYANQARCGDQANDLNYRNYGGSAQIDYNLGPATLTSITGYRKQIDAPNDFDVQGVAAEFLQIFYVGETSSGRQFSQELRIASNGAQKIDYVAGLFYSSYSGATGYIPGGAFNVGTFDIPPMPFMPPPFPFTPFEKSAPSTGQTNKSDAAFGQATYHLTDQLGLIGGIRYTHQTITDFTTVDPYNPASLAAYDSTSIDNWSGRLGLQYKIEPDLTTYFTMVRGYKGPLISPAQNGLPQSYIGPEIPTAFELGLKGSALNGKLGWDGDVFYTRVKDYQGQKCEITPVGALACPDQSVPKVISKGVELNAYGQVLTGLTFGAGYIYDEAQYPSGWTGYDPNSLVGGTTSLSNAQLVGVPKNKVTLSSLYAFPLTPALQGFVNADTVYRSAVLLGATGAPGYVYPANWNTGARLGVRSPEQTWSAALFVRNLSNDNMPVVIYGGPSVTLPGMNPANPAGYVNGISGWPTANSLRQVGITLDVKF